MYKVAWNGFEEICNKVPQNISLAWKKKKKRQLKDVSLSLKNSRDNSQTKEKIEFYLGCDIFFSSFLSISTTTSLGKGAIIKEKWNQESTRCQRL